MTLKLCSGCKEHLPLLNFHKDRTHLDGYKTVCKSCRKKENPRARNYSKFYYEKNSDSIKVKAINKYKSNPSIKAYKLAWNSKRRVALKGSESYFIPESVIIDTYGTLCHLCNLEIDMNAPRKPGSLGWQKGLHIDHVVPVSKGGKNIIENVRPAHGICNSRKGASEIDYLAR